MSTKLNGDIAEQIVILEALKRGFGVSVPIGNRLRYDLILDKNGNLYRIQVKKAYKSGYKTYIVNTKRTCTNRKEIKIWHYKETDFDFAIAVIVEENVCYIMPSKFFTSYKAAISLVETEKRQREPLSKPYREAWNLLQ